MQVTEVSDLRVRYLDEGTGHPLVLVHGWIGSLENFHTWSPAFAGHRRVLIPDLPGCGETKLGRERPDGVPALATFVRAFVERLGLGQHDIGGICLGATVALDYASRFPDSVSRLVLHTPVYSPATIRPTFARQARWLTWGPTSAAVARLRRNRTFSDLYKRFLSEGPGVDPYDAQVNFDNQIRADSGVARNWLRDGIRRDYREFLATWRKPVLVVVAADDRLVNVDDIRNLVQLMPQAEIRVIEAAGHGWTPTLIAAQVETIGGFLRASGGGVG